MVIHEIRQSLLILEKIEQDRLLARGERATKGEARFQLSLKLKCGLNTIDNIMRKRVNNVRGELCEKINALLIQETENQIARLTHDLDVYRRIASRLDSSAVSEIEAHITAAKTIFYGIVGEPKQRRTRRKTIGAEALAAAG